MNVSEDLKKQAIELGLCEKWTKTWGDNRHKELLLMKYVKGIKWCMDRGFPTIAYMKEHFDGVMEKYGVYLSGLIVLDNETTLVLKGDCKASLTYGDYSVGTAWIGDNADVEIKVSGKAIVYVHAYDNCRVKITAKDKSKVVVYKTSGSVICDGNVEIMNT